MTGRKENVPDEADYAPSPPGYHLFNFETGIKISADEYDARLIFSVNNIFNTRYRDYLDRFRYFTDAPGRNFILRFIIPFRSEKR
jgi:iron complex outermembrane receptor protein